MKKEKKEKLPKEKKVVDPKKEKKQTIIGMSITVTASIVVGVCIGTILRSTMGGNGYNNIPSIDESQYKTEIVTIKEKYNSALEENKNLSEVLTPVEMVQVSFNLLEGTNYMNECHGKNIQKNVPLLGTLTQVVTSMKAVYDNSVYAESISSGKVNLATRFIQSNEVIKCYDKDKLDSTRKSEEIVLATYKESKKTMTVDEYEGLYGSKLSDSTNLLISSKTIKEGTKPSIVQNADGGYTIELELSDVACYKYKKQILATESTLSGVGDFAQLKLTCKLNDKLYLQEYISDEEYDVKAFGAKVTCVASLKYTYYYDVTRDSFPNGTESYVWKGR